MAKIVLWKLGNLEHRVLPSQKGIEKLAEMIRDGVTEDKMKETLHVIWGPDISVEVIDVPEGAQHVVYMPADLSESPQPAVCPRQ